MGASQEGKVGHVTHSALRDLVEMKHVTSWKMYLMASVNFLGQYFQCRGSLKIKPLGMLSHYTEESFPGEWLRYSMD